MGGAPAQPITVSKTHGPARPGPSHGSETHETQDLLGLARQLRGPGCGFDGPAMGRLMCCPVLKGACAYADEMVSR